MKSRLFLLLIFLLPALAAAQERNFIIDSGSLAWRKVYTETASLGAVSRNFAASGLFDNIQAGDSLLTAEMHSVMLNYKDLGYRRMSLPLYIVNDSFSGFVTGQSREGRYRVTVERIMTHSPQTGDGTLEYFALPGGAFKPDFLKSPAHIIDYTFDCIFRSIGKIDDDDEW